MANVEFSHPVHVVVEQEGEGVVLRLERTLGASGPGRSCAATPGISSGSGGMLEQEPPESTSTFTL